MSVVTLDEMSAYCNNPDWSPSQAQHIEQAVLPGIQRGLETYLNRPIEPMHVREARQPDCEGRLWPTVTPVWNIIKIDYAPIGGSILTPSPYAPAVPMAPVMVTAREWDPAGTMMGAPNWMWQGGGVNYITIPGVPWDPSQPGIGGYVVVEYVGGYNGYVDEGLKLDIMRVAAREISALYDNSIGLRDGAGADAQISDRRDKGWTKDELAAWDRLRRRVVVT